MAISLFRRVRDSISPDPIASPFYNLNHYAGNNPSAFYDPDGLERRTGGAYAGAMEAMDLWGLFGGAKEAMKRDASAGEVASAFADDVQNTDWQTVGASASYGGLNTVSGGWFGEFVSAESYASATGANVGSNEWRAGYAMGATVTGAVVAALPGGATFMGAAHLSHGAYNGGRAIAGDSSITPGEVYGDLAAGVGLFGHGMRGFAKGNGGRILKKVQARMRKSKARRFYRKAGMPEHKIPDHLNGIDFSRPVSVVKLKRGQELHQYVAGGRTGRYFTTSQYSPSQVGISPAGRVATPYVVVRPTMALRSTAAPIVDTWTTAGRPYQTNGGGIQYYVPDTSAVARR